MAALTNRYEDDDACHLPSGMKRVGYDERTERYTFRQGDDLWLGEPGSFYGGKMKWAGKAPDAASLNDGEEDDDSDIDSFESGRDSKACKLRADGVQEGYRSLSYLQESKDEWGVPVASISDTNARPPDTALGRRGTQLKKVAKSTVTAISITRRWSRKTDSSRRGDQGKTSHNQGGNQDKKDIRLGRDSFALADKDLPILPAD